MPESGNGFTLKEKLLEIHAELKEFRTESVAADEKHDRRIKALEGHRESIMSSIKLIAWVIGLIGVSGAGAILRYLIMH